MDLTSWNFRIFAALIFPLKIPTSLELALRVQRLTALPVHQV